MKKNAMLKIAAVLLVAVLLTTCAISSTFAKYASTGKSFTDTARVAKWGINVTTTLDNSDSGFAVAYGSENADYVKSLNTDKVIAPGTSGEFVIKFAAEGTNTSEVQGKVIVRSNTNITTPEYNYLVVDSGLASKITWTLNGSASDVDSINDAIEAWNTDFAPGETKTIGGTLTIGWEWEFESGDDAGDTTLGAAGSAPITFSIYADIVQDGPAGAME